MRLQIWGAANQVNSTQYHSPIAKVYIIQSECLQACVSDQKNARLSGDLSGKLSSPAVQQLWTLYPGKQTANLFLWECFKPRALYDLTTQHTLPPATTVVIPKRFAGYKAQWLILLTRPEKKKFIGQDLRGGKRKNASSISPTLGLATVYCKTTTAKELWESLERKYKTEGCWYKEVRGSLFLDYKMVDSKNDDKSGSGPAVLLIARCRSGCIMSGKFGGLRLWTDCDGSCLSCVPDLYGFIMVEQLTMDRSVYGHLEMLFQGYAKNSSAYRFIVHESKNLDIQKNTVMESRNASFFEHMFPCLSKETRSSARLDDEVVQDKRQRDDNDLQDERQDQTEEEEVEPRRSKSARNEKSLVIKGFRQRGGLDYFDTYSPVTRITSIRMIFAIAVLRNLEVYQMDVKTAFLNGDLEEEIYMNQPDGFIAPGQKGKVCRLVKSLYGLKQSPRQWHQKFDHAMLESGFKINKCDKCVYVKDTSSGYVILCLYVDDMLIVGSNDKIIRSTKDMLKSNFDMKDMGLADVILGIKIIRTQNGLVLSQAHYVDKILNTHNAGDSGQARTPIDT
ncbi:retrotransposon protein, putative, ty1-copia subclass, partial [Tanacetum coccineum]